MTKGSYNDNSNSKSTDAKGTSTPKGNGNVLVHPAVSDIKLGVKNVPNRHLNNGE